MSWRHARRVLWVAVPLLTLAVGLELFAIINRLWNVVPASLVAVLVGVTIVRLRLRGTSDGAMRLPFSSAQQWAVALLFGIAFTTYRVIAGSEFAYIPGAGTVGIAIWFVVVLRRSGWSGPSERERDD